MQASADGWQFRWKSKNCARFLVISTMLTGILSDVKSVDMKLPVWHSFLLGANAVELQRIQCSVEDSCWSWSGHAKGASFEKNQLASLRWHREIIGLTLFYNLYGIVLNLWQTAPLSFASTKLIALFGSFSNCYLNTRALSVAHLLSFTDVHFYGKCFQPRYNPSKARNS